jgi:hypothetical protein
LDDFATVSRRHPAESYAIEKMSIYRSKACSEVGFVEMVRNAMIKVGDRRSRLFPNLDINLAFASYTKS